MLWDMSPSTTVVTHFWAVLVLTMIKRVFKRLQAGLTCHRVIANTTHMMNTTPLFTFGSWNNKAGIDTQELTIHDFGLRQPGANIFQRLQERLHETWSVTPTNCRKTSQWRCHNCSCGTKDAISHKNWVADVLANGIHASLLSVSRQASCTPAVRTTTRRPSSDPVMSWLFDSDVCIPK